VSLSWHCGKTVKMPAFIFVKRFPKLLHFSIRAVIILQTKRFSHGPESPPLFAVLCPVSPFCKQLPVNAQSVPCAAITRIRWSWKLYLISIPMLPPSFRMTRLTPAQLGALYFSPIAIQPGEPILNIVERFHYYAAFPAARELNSNRLLMGA